MEIGSVKPIKLPQNPEVDFETTLPTSATPSPVEQEAVKNEQEQKDPEARKEKVEEAVDKLNQTAIIFDRSLKFQIHDGTKETMVSVIDKTTDKVIREIPSKEVLDLVSKMRDYLGMIFDKKA